MVLDPEKCAGELEENELTNSAIFHDLQEDSLILVTPSSNDENARDVVVEMKSASSLGIKIGKHHSLKALLDSVLLEEEF